MQLHFWSTDSYTSYDEAKASNGIYRCDAPVDPDQFHSWGFDGGILCDAMQAVWTALDCVGMARSVKVVLVDGDKIYHEGDE